MWMNSNNVNAGTCPTGALSLDNIIPIYVRGRPETDPRKDIPKRPPPQRTENVQNENGGAFFNPFDWQNQFGVTAGFGMFGMLPGFGLTMVFRSRLKGCY